VDQQSGFSPCRYIVRILASPFKKGLRNGFGARVVRRKALGAGIEYGFTPNLSAKVEYLYVTGASLEISRTSEIRAGLNYRFSGL
jgi:hypothetical protein